jgi:hypothetical protein
MDVLLPILAIAIALTSFIVNYLHSRDADRKSRMPVLVFEYTFDSGWLLRNVGSGPALNILVAQAPGGRFRPCDEEIDSGWKRPVRIPPLPRGGECSLHWVAHITKASLGATFTDFDGHAYTVTCRNDLSQVCSGRRMPEWNEEEIKRHWSVAPSND